MQNFFDKINNDSYIYAKRSGSLFGTVAVSGAKNMVTKIMTASLLATAGKLTIKNVPFINEVFMVLNLFDQLGVEYKFKSDKTLEIKPKHFNSPEVNFGEEVGNRISLLLVAPILAQFGRAIIVKPRGCKIGRRKIDFHIEGLRRFGAKIKETEDRLFIEVEGKGLRGIDFHLPFSSVGATENLILNAVCAQGKTIIRNSAIEPEIIELIKFLQKAGVEIAIHGERNIHIKGRKEELKLSDLEVGIIADRVEIASLVSVALSTKGDIFIKGAKQDLIITFLGILQAMGAGIEIKDDGIRFFYKGKLKPVSVTTAVYPGFPTDFQQPFGILLSQIDGASFLHETIFEDRFAYLRILKPVIKDNKRIIISNKCPSGQRCRFADQGYQHFAKIGGPIEFGSGEVVAPDLRASFALVNAGCLSDGIKISNIGLLFRGYEHPVEKLRSLGADVKLIL